MNAPEPLHYVITLADGEFHLHLGSLIVLSGPDPKALSKYAFERDAASVRHDYDLRRAS